MQNADFVDEIYIEEEGDKFVFDTKVELAIGQNTYYKQTLIKEEEFKNILGEEGKIEIYSQDGELVGTITKETKSIDGIYVFDYDVDINQIILKIINPINNSALNIKHVKAVKAELEYSRKQIELFKNIQTVIKTKAVYKEENIWELEPLKNLINLEETESRMELDLNTYDFSTMLENQVTFNVTLKTNEERYDLFQDPTIEILMPSAIENIEITSVNLLYKNGLSLSNWEVITNEAGKKVIKVGLSGNQTEYTPGSMQEGTTLVIYTKINVNKLTSNTEEKIKMTYTNKNSSKLYYEINGKEAEEVEIRFVSKEGILKSNCLLNFNESLEGMYGFNDEVLIGKLDVEGSRKTATVNMAVVNNYSKELDNVSIIGRIPSQGIKDANGNDLGTTINTILLNAINYSGVSANIYYSPKIDASIDDESWTEQVVEYGLIKSYKIEIENPMKQGDRAEFGYNILIPENLNYNETLFSTYQVNYHIDNQLITEISIIGAETEKREIILEDCQNQVEQEVVTKENEVESLTVGMTVTKGGQEVEEGEEIFERQILRYTAILKNTTNKELNNLKIKGKAANSNLYYLKVLEKENYGENTKYKVPVEDDGTKEYEELNIEKLKPNEEVKLEFEVIVKEVEETAEEYVFGEVYISSDELEETKIETSKNKIKQAKLYLDIRLGATESIDGKDLFSNSSVKYCIKVGNLMEENIENLKLNVFIPGELEYDSDIYYCEDPLIQDTIEPMANGKKIVLEIPSLEKRTEKEIFIICGVKEFDLLLEKKDIIVVSNIEIENEKYISNDYIKTAYQTQTDIEYKFTSNLPNNSEVDNQQEIEYKIELKNKGYLETTIEVLDILPYGLDINKVTLLKEEKEINIEPSDGYVKIKDILKGNEKIEIYIKAQINTDNLELGQEYIENNIEIIGSKIKEITTNTISFKVKTLETEDEESELNKEDLYTEEELEKFEKLEKKEEEGNQEVEENIEPEENKGMPNQNKPDNIEIEEENDTEEKSQNNKQENTEKDKESNQKQEDDKPNNNNQEKEKNSNNVESLYIGKENIVNKETTKGKQSIKGNVWKDLNKDGKNDTNEEKLENINVRLYKSTNGTSVVYSTNNLINKVKTNSEGNYEFNNLEDGYYLVMVEYDSKNYNLTQYKSDYAGESLNSDFITKTTTIDGEKKTVAISDIIQINFNNSSFIDLGLIQKDEIDIEINKTIASITIEDDEGKQTLQYNEEKIAKLEIAPKKLDKTKITIIYEFNIKNNGDLDTYVTNLADYLPKGLKFDEKSNTGWYIGEDNNLYNLSLVNTKIEPGKTKKLKLALTQEVTDDTLGSYINKVEILDTTNDKKIKETDLENNKAEIELLITIKTGGIVFYLGIIVLLVGVAIGIIFIIKKKKSKVMHK